MPDHRAMVHTRPAYRFLYKRLRLPRRTVHGLLSGAKRMLLRQQILERDRIARSFTASPTVPSLRIDEGRGFVTLEPDDLPGTVEAVDHAQSLLRKYQDDGRAASGLQRNPTKRFLLSVVAGGEFAEHLLLLRLMLSRRLLNAASTYLGTVPRLEGAALWWNPPNDTRRTSQAWHIDELSPRQVKVIVNCTDVGDDQGPLNFLPADVSESVLSATRHRRGRLPDDAVERHAPANALQRATGPPGSGVMFDSSRCLHFGSRGNLRDRLVLAFHYLPIDAPTETRYHLSLPRLPPGLDDLDDVQRLALGAG